MSRKQRPCLTGKERFDNSFAAEVELWKCRALRAMGRAHRLEDRTYPCEFCNGWHLTSQPQRSLTPVGYAESDATPSH